MNAVAASAGRDPVRLGVLLSGRGSNFVAIAESIRAGRLTGAEIAVVISNMADAGGLKAARELGLPQAVLVSKGRKRAEHDAEVIACLRAHGVDLVCLAGYMRLLSPEFIAAFPNRILNIHPSLLPAFPGLEAQEQAFEYGVKVAGCTVHFVDERSGPWGDRGAAGDSGVGRRRRALAGGADSGGGASGLHRGHSRGWRAESMRFAAGGMCKRNADGPN